MVTGTVTSYTISPALPAGLSMSAATGAISGTPTTADATASYLVTASNSGGSTTASITMTVIAHNFWILVSGSDATLNGAGSSGTRGVAAPSNQPASRQDAGTWTDTSGNLWLFGGESYAFTNSTTGELNDLWKFSIATGEWTWISGTDQPGGTTVYGTRGTAAAANTPGGRSQPLTWTDSSGNLWMFGGTGLDGCLDELWMFSPSSGEWTWVGGSQAANIAPTYGTQGVTSATNDPGGRAGGLGDLDGRFGRSLAVWGSGWLHQHRPAGGPLEVLAEQRSMDLGKRFEYAERPRHIWDTRVRCSGDLSSRALQRRRAN